MPAIVLDHAATLAKRYTYACRSYSGYCYSTLSPAGYAATVTTIQTVQVPPPGPAYEPLPAYNQPLPQYSNYAPQPQYGQPVQAAPPNQRLGVYNSAPMAEPPKPNNNNSNYYGY
ncbi:hypothetical protein HDU79_002059 [Rhizoclosmatium sp. JEL0117]|nr:hypothetical protein HDU79_002059 [Rhizoclosmatium sp. JEL0117]